MNTFQDRLRELRRQMNLTQKKLADVLQTTNSSICDWECGRSEPDLNQLIKLAKIFDVSTDFLLGLEDETGAKLFSI